MKLHRWLIPTRTVLIFAVFLSLQQKVKMGMDLKSSFDRMVLTRIGVRYGRPHEPQVLLLHISHQHGSKFLLLEAGILTADSRATIPRLSVLKKGNVTGRTHDEC